MRNSLVPVSDALRAALPTSRHARMAFDMLVDALGDQAVVATANGGTLLDLYRRDPVDARLIVPWRIAQICLTGRIGFVSRWIHLSTGEPAPEPEPAPGKAYKLRGLGSAELRLCDGSAFLDLFYGADGTVAEASLDDRFPNRLGDLVPALASKRAQAAELVAACVASIDPGRHGPGRVQMPVPMPAGPGALWELGRAAARRALYTGQVPAEARYLVVDGVSGSAVGVGATFEEARADFERRVAARMPSPAEATPCAWDDDYDDDGRLLRAGRGRVPRGDADAWKGDAEEDAPGSAASLFPEGPGAKALGGGFMRFAGPSPDLEMPALDAVTLPRVIIPLAGAPTVPAPLGRWERTLGARGATGHVARLVRPGGFLQLGEQLVWRVDPRTLDVQLDEADAANEAGELLFAQSPSRRFVRYRTRGYRWVDADERRPARFEEISGAYGPHYEGLDLDGDVEPGLVRRWVKIKRADAAEE